MDTPLVRYRPPPVLSRSAHVLQTLVSSKAPLELVASNRPRSHARTLVSTFLSLSLCLCYDCGTRVGCYRTALACHMPDPAVMAVARRLVSFRLAL